MSPPTRAIERTPLFLDLSLTGLSQGGERSGLAVRSKPESDRQMVPNGMFSDLILAGDHTRSGTPLSLSMDDCPSTDGGFLSGLLGEQV